MGERGIGSGQTTAAPVAGGGGGGPSGGGEGDRSVPLPLRRVGAAVGALPPAGVQVMQ
jgi:hypothetical protein